MFRRLKLLWRHRAAIRPLLSSHLSLLEGDEGAEALGGLSDAETAALVAWMREASERFPGRPFIEFGTLFGLTAQALADAAPDGVRIVTVDNFCWNPLGLPPDRHEAFARRILAPWIARGKVELVNADSASFRAGYKGPKPAMVFFDADHRYEAAREELAWAVSSGIPFICGHDYGNPSPRFGVTRAVAEAFGAPDAVAGMCYLHRASGKGG